MEDVKVYEVLHTVVGAYIGHGLTDDTIETVSIHATEDGANEEAKRLEKENGGEYWVKAIKISN